MTPLVDFAASAWIPAALLCSATLCFRWASESWMAPAPFLGLFWVGNLTASLLAVDHTVPPLGVWVLVMLILGFQLGALLVPDGKEIVGTLLGEVHPSVQPRLRRFCLLLAAIAMLGIVGFVIYSLDLFALPFSLLSMIQMTAKWTLLRYDGYADPWTLRLAAIWIYPPPLLGGILFSMRRRRWDTVAALLSIAPALLYTLLTGGRAAFLVGITCWLAGCWSMSAALGRSSLRIFRLKSLVAAVLGAGILLLLFLAVNAFRGSSSATSVDQLALEFNSGQVRNYMFGSSAAFAEWFNRGDEAPLSWGALTFPGLFEALHIQQKTLGTYTNSEPTVGLEGTNIYTVFRGLIQDFGLLGALSICCFAGYISTLAYRSYGLGGSSTLCLAGFYAIAIFSPLYCLFGFNGPIFAWLLAWLGLNHYVKPSFVSRTA